MLARAFGACALSFLVVTSVASANPPTTVVIEGETYHCADRTPAQEVQGPQSPPSFADTLNFMFPERTICPAGQVPEPRSPSNTIPPSPSEIEGYDYYWAHEGSEVLETEEVTGLEGYTTSQDNYVGEGGHSISQLWAENHISKEYDNSDIEFGWTDETGPYDIAEPDLFVFRIDDGQVCSKYNACGYVQVSNLFGYIAGYPIRSPASLLSLGEVHHYQLLEEGTSGEWLVLLDGEEVGYFPASAWSKRPLIYLKQELAGGEVSGKSATPSITMGDGYPASSEQSAYWSGIQDISKGSPRWVKFHPEEGEVETGDGWEPAAYSLGEGGTFIDGGPAGSNFRYGGPGWCKHGSPGYCGPPVAKTESVSGIQLNQATLHGTIVNTGGEGTTKYHFVYGFDEESLECECELSHVTPEISAGTGPVEATVTGLKEGETYYYEIVVSNSAGKQRGSVVSFMTPQLPFVITKEAKEITRTSAVIEGIVNPVGVKTEYWLEYGEGSFEAKTTPEEASTSGWHADHATYGSLEACSEYQFRIVASNEYTKKYSPGGVIDGDTEHFTTKCKPLVQAVATSELKPGSVILDGEVNPQEAETTYHFEYDTREYKEGEAAHGTSVPAPAASLGSGAAFVAVNEAVVNLIPDQTYYFRVVAKNVSGETASAEGSFKPPEDWEMGGKLVTTATPVKSEGAILVEGEGGLVNATAECSVKEEGNVDGGAGEITKVTGVKGEPSIACVAVKKGLSCEGTTAEVQAVGLPWSTELVNEPVKNAKGEVTGYSVRNRVYGSGAGWMLKCDVSKEIHTTSCVGETSGNVENISAGVPVEFDVKSPRLDCAGKEAAGMMEGALVFSAEGSVLSAYGAKTGPLAPNVVTGASSVTSTGATLNGTVAAKALETTYHFEYGKTTAYGSSVPVPSGSIG
ncbi:MAG: neprosin family prolyl endopeptidase, partial [Solirubrobacteraceae bacterium]